MEEDSSYVKVGIINKQGAVLFVEKLLTLLQSRCPEIRVITSLTVDSDLSLDSKNPLAGISQSDLAKLQSVEILIANPYAINMKSLEFSNLKWMHIVWAGVDLITRDMEISKAPNYVVTRNGVSFVESLAQYVIGYILARERHHKLYDRQQRAKIWEYIPYRSLSNVTIGILGIGMIGKEIARLAKSMRMVVWGLVRTQPAEDKKSEHVDEYRLTNQLPELLSSCDYVCSVLPSTKETDGLLDGDVLSFCKAKKSVFINIGRGNVVKNTTILRALDEGWLSHAILDVFESEPLPKDSELWTREDVTITPHGAGSEIDVEQFVDVFATNLKLYLAGKQMNYVIDWTKGY